MIYLDNNATTQPLPAVVEAMSACMRDDYANPSSVHQSGQRARHLVEQSRAKVAALIGANPKQIIFTSGGTESTNFAMRGAVSHRDHRRRIVTTAVEHSATLSVAANLESQGYEIVRVGVNGDGIVDEGAWADAIDESTALVSVCHTNNETGVIADVKSLVQAAADRGAIVHVDAVQAVGKLPLSVNDLPIDLLSMSAHKLHGPKGVGALYVRDRNRLTPLIVGGTQEGERRGGTENVPGIAGFGAAAEVAAADMAAVAEEIGALRDRFEQGIIATIPGSTVIASGASRIHTTSCIAFSGLEAEAILILLSESGICASAGAACSSGSLEPSHVLAAMNISEPLIRGAIRFSLSRINTVAEVDEAISRLREIVGRLRSLGGE